MISRILKFVAGYGIRDKLQWETSNNDQLIFYVVCDNLFWIETSDGQIIADETIDSFESAVIDVRAVDAESVGCGPLLYCCRQRKMRPNGLYYEHISQLLWPLFDACGEKRTIGLSNPKPPRLCNGKAKARL